MQLASEMNLFGVPMKFVHFRDIIQLKKESVRHACCICLEQILSTFISVGLPTKFTYVYVNVWLHKMTKLLGKVETKPIFIL